LVRRIGSLRLCQDGLEYPGLRGREAPCANVEGIVKHLIGQIRRRCPQGPYGLCGYSFGGIMAYEAACQMRLQGLEVDALILWDAMPRQCQAHYVRPLREALFELSNRFRRRNASAQAGLIRQVIATKFTVGSQRIRGLSRLLIPESPHELVARASAAAERAYRPQPYDGDMVLFRSQELGGIFNGVTLIPGKGWESMIRGKLEVIVIPGSHLDLWRDPSFGILAQQTADWLKCHSEGALARSEEPPVQGARPWLMPELSSAKVSVQGLAS
jgi:thioesterase domain-containing protein